MSDRVLAPWSVRAINLPEHANNVVHTDEGARAAGYERALVAGTSVYAYLSHVPAAGWGQSWLTSGGAEVRFASPVNTDDQVELVPVTGPDGITVEARVQGEVRSTLAVWPGADPLAPPDRDADPEPLPDMVVEVDDGIGRYGTRAGDDLGLYDQAGPSAITHPAIWPVIGNRVTMANLVTGPWVHVRSRVQHLAVVPMGAVLLVQSSIIDRFTTRAGNRAVLGITVSLDGNPVATIAHESIIELTSS